MKRILISCIVIIFILGCVQPTTPLAPATTNTTPIACQEDALLCPDGSYVERVPPSCAFAACPSTTPPSTPPITAPPTTPAITAPTTPANAALPNPGICPQLLQPETACAGLVGITPYYIEPGQTVTIDGGFTSLPPFANEQYECRWHPSATYTGSLANRHSAGITIQAMYSESDADFGLLGFARGAPIMNRSTIYEEENAQLFTTTRIHARAIGSYIISIQQETGSNTTPVCSPAEEEAIFSAFNAP